MNSKIFLKSLLFINLAQLFLGGVELPKWKDLFNGKDLTGWVNVNTSPSTWYVKDGLLIAGANRLASCGARNNMKIFCSMLNGDIWKLGNSGIFAWSDAIPLVIVYPRGLRFRCSILNG